MSGLISLMAAGRDEQAMPRLPDLAHGPLSELADQLVAPQLPRATPLGAQRRIDPVDRDRDEQAQGNADQQSRERIGRQDRPQAGPAEDRPARRESDQLSGDDDRQDGVAQRRSGDERREHDEQHAGPGDPFDEARLRPLRRQLVRGPEVRPLEEVQRLKGLAVRG